MTAYYTRRPLPADLAALQDSSPLPPGWEYTGRTRGIRYTYPSIKFAGLRNNDPDEAQWLSNQLQTLANNTRHRARDCAHCQYQTASDILRQFATSHMSRTYQAQYRASTLVT